MKTAVRWLGLSLLVVGLAIGGYILGMGFADGPSGVFIGGPFKTGKNSEAPDGGQDDRSSSN